MIDLARGETCIDRFFAREIRAGRLSAIDAMLIANTHTRAEVLADIDGWDDILAPEWLIEKTPRGELYAPEWLETRLLRVFCPSTGNAYVLGVGAKSATVAQALLEVNRGLKNFGGMES
jgi:hypothetical protein